MNKFSDGFSENSYEELLKEYAGDSLGSKSKKPDGNFGEDFFSHTDDPFKKTGAKERKTPDPIFDFDLELSRKDKASDFSLDLNDIEPYKPERTIKKEEPKQDTAPFEPIKRAEEIGEISLPQKNIFDGDDLFSDSSREPVIPPSIEKTIRQNTAKQKATKTALSLAERLAAVKGAAKLARNNASADENGEADGYRPRRASVQNKLQQFKKSSMRKAPEDSFDDDFSEKAPRGKFNAKTFFSDLGDWAVRHQRILAVTALCLVISVTLSSYAISCLNDILAIGRNSEEVIEVELPNEPTAYKAMKALDKAGLIKHRFFCYTYIQVMKMGDGTAKQYLPGVYYFTENMGVEKMNASFKTSVKKGNTISITIPEGYTIDQIFERLEKNGICSADALYKQISNTDLSNEYDFIKNIPNKDERYHALEGYIFPATYEFEQGADPSSVIRKFLDTFKSRWTKEYSDRASELSMTPDQIITLASIIEKEGNSPEQFGIISSVLHNRLNRSGVYTTLDCNSTKDYYKNYIVPHTPSSSQQSAYFRLYSTYDCFGLPAGPICNPGKDAIEAALYPDATQYYFFRHDKYGKLYPAKNSSEHDANGREVDRVNKGG